MNISKIFLQLNPSLDAQDPSDKIYDDKTENENTEAEDGDDHCISDVIFLVTKDFSVAFNAVTSFL